MPPMKLGSKWRPLGATVVSDGTVVVVDGTIEDSVAVELLDVLDVVVAGAAELQVEGMGVVEFANTTVFCTYCIITYKKRI